MSSRRRHGRETGASRKSAAPFRCRLVVMVKVPVAGRAKTRLAHEIGVAEATRFARHAAAALLQRVAFDPRWQTTIAVAPDGGVASRSWPQQVARMAQGGGDLGVRMQRIFDRMGPGPVVIVGTDVPDIGAAHIGEAFRLLGSHGAVFGPATDGGFWLVGLKRRPHVLRPFSRVRWSSPHAFADTLENLGGCAIARLSTLFDVDDARDFACCAGRLGRRIRPASVPHSSL